MATKKIQAPASHDAYAPSPIARLEGKVRWFDDRKGFGFIAANDGTDVFVHYTGIVKGAGEKRVTLMDDEEVSYEMGQGKDDRPCAVNVVRL